MATNKPKKTSKPTPKPAPKPKAAPKPVPPFVYGRNSFAEAAFVASVSEASYNVDSAQTISLFSTPDRSHVKAVIESSIDTEAMAKTTLVSNYNPNPGDLFLLTGQSLATNVGAWVESSYQRGAKVKYLGEVYYAVAAQTGTNPPAIINTEIRGNAASYKRINNPDWVLIGNENSASAAPLKSIPSVLQSNEKYQNKWQIYCIKGQEGFIIQPDPKLPLSSTYVIGQAPGQPFFFPPGTTFTTEASGHGPGAYSASARAIRGNSDMANPNRNNASDYLAFVTISTVPNQTPDANSSGKGNGIYRYNGPDLPLMRLDAGDVSSSAPMSYSFLMLLEDDPSRPLPGTTKNGISQYWISDDQGNWSRVSYSGISKGHNYWYWDIAGTADLIPWRSKDASIGGILYEWSPTETYYQNDVVLFNDQYWRATSYALEGFSGQSPLNSDYWTLTNTPGVGVSGSVGAVRGRRVLADPVEMQARTFSLTVTDKLFKITSPVRPVGAISFNIIGDSEIVYSEEFSSHLAHESMVYKSDHPISFSLNNFGIEVSRVLWSFGDGRTSTELEPTHYYSVGSVAPMPFEISVTVTAVDGRVYNHSRTINLRKTDVSLLGIPIVASPPA